uniref:High-affinity glucose transporter HXT2 n=1 Tax=Lygus hesperus TaxID=30085 RepID=A0A0A9WYA9_LYGHE
MGIIFIRGFTYDQIPNGWKVVLGFPIAIGAINLLLFHWIPESPCWLLREGRYEDAEATLNFVYNVPESVTLAGQHDPAVTEELSDLQTELDNERQIESASWMEVFQSGRILFICLFLQFWSPLSGINVLMFYSTTIFNIAGVKEAIIGTITIDVLNVILTVLQMYIVERAGRTALLNYGTILSGLSFLLLGITLIARSEKDTIQGVFAVIFTLTYICGFAVGLGAVTWAIMAEVTPARIRNKVYALAVGENWG